MSIAFVMMQIGNADLDGVFEEAIEPAIVEAGLSPRRVDRHNEGGLLKSEIVQFMHDAEIIVADLTNERPNVYLEVGYAMGIDKFRNLILTCRDDHLPGRDGWDPDGPKVHFDLAGYDILLWNQDELGAFREELADRIRRRRALTASVEATGVPTLDDEWVESHRSVAGPKMGEYRIRTFMEVALALAPPKPEFRPSELLEAAEGAMVRTFGWPIGVVLHVDEHKPRPRADGIVADIHVDGDGENHYDYWALRRNGDFYLRKSIFEDKRDPEAIFFNTRILRNAEVVLYALRLYDRLGVDRSTRFELELTYGGFRGRRLSQSSNRMMMRHPVAAEDRITTRFEGSLESAEANLTKVVRELTAPFFALFDFYEFEDSIYDSIVSRYIEGQVS